METLHDGATDGGPKGPSRSVQDDQGAVMKFARRFNDLIIRGGKPAPLAEVQIDLRSKEAQEETIAAFVDRLAPSEVSTALWADWLNGGSTPFQAKRLEKPVATTHGTGKTVERLSKSLHQYRDKVARAKADLAHAEDTLAYHEAMEKSLMNWCVTDGLLKVLAPIFAMGPAWTLMRAVSGHLSEEEARQRTVMVDDEVRERAFEQLRAAREKESSIVLEALDFWSGDMAFENQVRAAILEVVTDFEPRRQEAVNKGRRRRRQDDMRSSANPDALQDQGKVLEGLQP